MKLKLGNAGPLYWFTMVSRNGRLIMTSKGYRGKHGKRNAITTMKSITAKRKDISMEDENGIKIFYSLP